MARLKHLNHSGRVFTLVSKCLLIQISRLREKKFMVLCGYDIASHPFVIVAASLFLPLLLEDLAWRSGSSNPSDTSWPPCYDRSNSSVPKSDCFVKFGTAVVTPASYTLYMQVFIVILQVFTFISLGSMADHSNFRKKLLMSFGSLGALSCIGYLFVLGPDYLPLASLLFIVSIIAYGTAIVFYYAYLPVLVEAHEDIRKLKEEAVSTS